MTKTEALYRANIYKVFAERGTEGLLFRRKGNESEEWTNLDIYEKIDRFNFDDFEYKEASKEAREFYIFVANSEIANLTLKETVLFTEKPKEALYTTIFKLTEVID